MKPETRTSDPCPPGWTYNVIFGCMKDKPLAGTGARGEPLPDGNPKTAQGAKKPPTLSVIPSSPLLQVGAVMKLGREKYGPFNWRDQPVTASTYIDAAMRHLMSWWDGETIDPESGVSHLAHAAAGLFIIMDALATGHGTDDRPKPGAASELIQLYAQRGTFGADPAT